MARSWLQPTRFLAGPNLYVPTSALVVHIERMAKRLRAERRAALVTSLPEVGRVPAFSTHPTLAGAVAALADRLNTAVEVKPRHSACVISDEACALPCLHEPYGRALSLGIAALIDASGSPRFPQVRDGVLVDLMKTRDAPYREIFLLARAAE